MKTTKISVSSIMLKKIKENGIALQMIKAKSWFLHRARNGYRVFSRGVSAAMLVSLNKGMAVMLVSLNKGMAAMLVSPTKPPSIELYSYANVFFCFA